MRLLDVAPAGADLLSPRAVVDNTLYSDDGSVWGWWRVPLTHLDYLTAAEQEREAYAAANVWAGLAGYDVHILTAQVPADPDGWARQLTASAWQLRGDWADWMASAVGELDARGDRTKAVFVGVRLGTRKPPLLGWRLAGLFGKAEYAAGVDDPVVDGREQERWLIDADDIGTPLTGGIPGVEPATADELAWLIAHSLRRGRADDVPVGTSRWGPGELAFLAEGVVEQAKTFVRTETVDGLSTYHAHLAVARIPQTMTWPPGAPWLCLHEALQDHVEVSARWKIVGHLQAGKDVSAKTAAARDQADHVEQAGATPSGRDLERLAAAAGLETALDRDHTPLIYTSTRLIVTAPSPQELDSICGKVVDRYRKRDIHLSRPSHDQLALFLEAVPGDKVRVAPYRQFLDPPAVGAALPNAGEELGDRVGPYFGYTTGSLSQQPVHWSPFTPVNRRDQQRSTTAAVVGANGGGKTVDLLSMAAAAGRMGARVFAFDPKGDLAALAALPGIDVDVVDLTDAPDGVLDPWALVDDTDTAKMVALEVIHRLMAGELEPRHKTAIGRAVQAESKTARPSLSGVVDLLERGNDAAQDVASTLGMCRTLPLARLAFRPPDGQLTLGDGITVITTPGVEFPQPGTDLAAMSWPKRLAVTATYLVGTYARRTVLHSERTRPKLISFDEAWALAATDQGQALIQEVSRMGRSRFAALALASQAAGDLAGVLNCISTVFAHRIESDAEGEAVARLLGVTPSRALTADLFDLRPGEAIMRDLDRRVGRMRVDVEWDPTLAAMLDHNRDQTEERTA